MSELIVIAFSNRTGAHQCRTKLMELEQRHLLSLEDAVVVEHRDNGKVKLFQTHDLVASGALSGGFWGAFLGLLFAAPLVGILAGSTFGALSGKLTDVGINDEFMKKLGQSLTPNSSALFLLVRKAKTERIVDELRPFDGQIMQTSLDEDDERRLRALIESAATEGDDRRDTARTSAAADSIATA